jgi:hypothetical protein
MSNFYSHAHKNFFPKEVIFGDKVGYGEEKI